MIIYSIFRGGGYPSLLNKRGLPSYFVFSHIIAKRMPGEEKQSRVKICFVLVYSEGFLTRRRMKGQKTFGLGNWPSLMPSMEITFIEGGTREEKIGYRWTLSRAPCRPLTRGPWGLKLLDCLGRRKGLGKSAQGMGVRSGPTLEWSCQPS